jgi:integrase/recombinase XerD
MTKMSYAVSWFASGELEFSPRLSIHVLGKGRRERALPLWRETATALRAWLTLRPTGQATEVLFNTRGAAMTPLRIRVHSG